MKRKGLAVLGLVAGLSVLSSMSAFAMPQFGNDYHNEWVWLDDNNDGIEECYYFDENGTLADKGMTPDKYMVGQKGAWVQNNVVQQRHVADGTPLNVSVYKDEETGKKVFNVEGIEIVAEVPAETKFTWVQGGWANDPGVGDPIDTTYCTVDDIQLFKCRYIEPIFFYHDSTETQQEKIFAVTFIINGKMTEIANSQKRYAAGNFTCFNTITKEEYNMGQSGVNTQFTSGTRTLEEAIFGSRSTTLAEGDTYYTDITLYIPVGAKTCTLRFY